nr:hypothetical protein [uncultured Enterobacter sp.]
MSTETLLVYVEEQLNLAAQRIVDKADTSDEVAAGKIDFFIALRSALKGDLDKRELGIIGAVNDTLQFIGVIDSNTTFYKV